MQNHVTFETSVRLKEAGFPQPEPEAGQIWYDPKDEKAFFVIEVNEELRDVYWATVGEYGDEGKFNANQMGLFVLAPTAADILRELKRLVGEHIEVQMETYEKEFVVRMFEDLPFGNFDTVLETNEDPAEAAAQAFLNLEAKP